MNCVIYPDGTREQTTYNEAGYPASITDREGRESLYAYDERNNLTVHRTRGEMPAPTPMMTGTTLFPIQTGKETSGSMPMMKITI